MKAKVLGSAAGGGFPQWNCGCANCVEVRRGNPRTRARTQDSIAVSGDGGERWMLVNASPDVLRHIEGNAELQPRAPRSTPIAGVVLTNGDVDHVLGLFCLRESQPLTVFATEAVWRGLTAHNVLFRTLERFPGHTTWRRLVLDEPVEAAGVRFVAFAAPGKRPVHLERAGEPAPSPEDNVALRFHQPAADKTLVYAAAATGPGPWIERAADADVLLLDGTFWSSDELVKQGLGTSRAEDMAHWPIEKSLEATESFRAKRRIYTHINNTNPVLFDGSAERRAVERAGWEIAYDGMELAP